VAFCVVFDTELTVGMFCWVGSVAGGTFLECDVLFGESDTALSISHDAISP